ncbi:MAG: hypothetical protein AAGE96_24985 [Cyanobacteria bacterium P01_G01_bin.19]
MITKVKSRKHTKKYHQQKYSLTIDVGKPKVPLSKKLKTRSPEKLEDWIDAS